MFRELTMGISDTFSGISDKLDRITGNHKRIQEKLDDIESQVYKDDDVMINFHNTYKPNENVQKIIDFANDLPNLVTTNIDNRIVYSVENGECTGEGLIRNDQFAMQRAFMSQDATFPLHEHDEYEILIIISGQLTAYFNNGHKTADTGDVIYFEPNQKHKIIANEDTWMIAITIPAAEGYPDAT